MGEAGLLATPTRAGAAALELRRRIIEGRYAAGEQLRQDALAAEFGISRIPIREALVQLEAEGLVKIHPHRGAVVTDLSSTDIAELFELRHLLEPHLLRLSVPHLTEADFTALDAILASYAAELAADQVATWGTRNTAFHAGLYSRAGRPRIEAQVQQLLQSSDRYARLQLRLTDGRARADREHRQILELCRARDADRACALLADHIAHARDGLLEHLRGAA
jgi:DNA-binding GntR family transcriptional regulator